MESLRVAGDIVSLTGVDCAMMKDFLFNIFGGEVTSEYCKIHGMPCKKAANCGVRSTKARLLSIIDFPPYVSDMVQKMGRVGLGPRYGGIPYRRHGLFNLNSYIFLILRVDTNSSATEASQQQAENTMVMSFFVSPYCCYHVFL